MSHQCETCCGHNVCAQGKSKARRVKTIYDCQADNDDELTFVEGEVIIVTGEEDQEWWVSTGDPAHRTAESSSSSSPFFTSSVPTLALSLPPPPDRTH